MRWFKHETKAYMSLKIQSVIENFGLEAVGYYWICVELVASQGENFRIKGEKLWKSYLTKITGLSIDKQDQFLEFFGEINLIDKKAHKHGILSIPKLKERADEYTQKLRRKSRHISDKVPLDKNRLDKNRLEYTIGYLDAVPEKDIKEFLGRFIVSEKQVKSLAEDLRLYCQRKGKKYKNYRAFLLNGLKRDFKERDGAGKSKYL